MPNVAGQRSFLGCELAVSLLTIVNNFLSRGLDDAISVSIPVFIIIAVVIGIYFVPIDSRIKGYIYSLVIFAAATFSLVQDPTDQALQYTIAASITVLGLYYSATLIRLSYLVNPTIF